MPGDTVGAAMNLGESTPRSAAGGERGWPDRAAVERAVHDFQRGVDREKNFEILFHCFRPRVERFLAPRVFSPEERLDLTQTIFLRIYQGLEGYRGEGSLEGWLLQVTFNVYRKWRDRQPGGQHEVPEVALDPAEVPETQAASDSSAASNPASPLDHAVRRERLAALKEAITELPRQQRHCMELRVYQERSVKEIAVALKISPETVKAHLFQARQRLWDRLHGAFGAIEF
jgi:RNA polymerase sigma-70 factor (ECF subfamily)